jgi:hypothetical protein
VVLGDNGDLTEARGRQDELKAEALLEFFREFHYAALNLGEQDYALSLPQLLALQDLAEVPLLSANVCYATDGLPLFREYVVAHPRVGGEPVAVAILGVLSETFAEEVSTFVPELEVQPVADTLDRLAPEVQEAAKVFVLLYHGPRAEALALAKTQPWLHVILAAHGAEDPVEPVRVGQTWVLEAGQKAKHVGRVSLRRDAQGHLGVQPEPLVPLGPEFSDAPAGRALLNRYLQRVRDENLLAQGPRRPTRTGDTFAGSQACAPCHEEAQGFWRQTSHAQAYETLRQGGHERDPECVVCHVVGLSYEGGFADPQQTPALTDVGCESCHGPLARHAAGQDDTPPPKAGESSCQPCHVPDHSPRFEFGPYWEKVRH